MSSPRFNASLIVCFSVAGPSTNSLKRNVVIFMKFSTMSTLKTAILTILSTPSDENFVKMTSVLYSMNSELRTQNFIWQHYGHIGGDRFINASRFSNGWYWNKAGEYSFTKLTKKYNLQRFNKEMMPYLVGVMLSGVPLRHIAAIIGPLQRYNLNEKETDVAENFRLYVCHTLYGYV